MPRFLVGTPLRQFGGTVAAGGTEPAAPTITVTNNQDGTADVVITGSTSGASNAVKTAPNQSGTLVFTTQGTQVGNGTVVVTLSTGIFVFLVDSTKDSLSTRSNIVVDSVTASTLKSDLGEIWKQLRTDMLAESQLTGLLADATSIYFGPIDAAVALPALVFKPQDAPTVNSSFVGLSEPQLQIDVLALDPYTPIEIAGVLAELFSIPAKRVTAVESVNLKLTRMVRQAGTQILTTKSTVEDQPVRVLPTIWNCRVIQKL